MIQQKQHREKPSELEAACKREWDADSILRAEFCETFSTYLAFREAEAAGKVRIHGVKHHV